MPTYEYACSTCHHRFEAWQKMSDEPLTICPECGAHIRRVLYPAGIVFKGSGFYKTDHGNGSVAAKTDGATETKKTDGASTETKAAGENKTGESKTSEGKTSESRLNGKKAEPTASKVA
ncbi:MAG TPA: FmdB family zinc ribbon protein [Ktedonobacteraceae bacterium]|nr:FmdB family zinc ribbon protein [Ktedonobacteraceae bacterium]